jgi:hypothetical protein
MPKGLAAKGTTSRKTPLSDVLTQHADKFRTGKYSEARLNWKNVNVSSFGKVNELSTHGFIWAQPLFVSDVSVPGRKSASTDLVIVATAENWIYTFDANEPRGSENAVVWSSRFGFPVPSLSFGNGAGDIYRSTVGILGTPVIAQKRQMEQKAGRFSQSHGCGSRRNSTTILRKRTVTI